MNRFFADTFIMQSCHFHKRTRRLVISATAAALLMTGAMIVLRESAQEAKTSAIIKYWKDRCPIDIKSFTIGNDEYELNKPFRASPEWFRDIAFNLENNTQKTISYVDVAVTFMPPKDAMKILPFRIEIWRGGREDALNRRDSGLFFGPSSSHQPDDSSTLKIRAENPDREYNLNRSSLDRLGFPLLIGEVEVQVAEVVFTDGLMWSAGHWYKLDPGGSQKLVLVDEEGNELKNVALFPLRWSDLDRRTDDEDPDLDQTVCYDTIIGYKTCGTAYPGCSARTVMVTSEPYYKGNQG